MPSYEAFSFAELTPFGCNSAQHKYKEEIREVNYKAIANCPVLKAELQILFDGVFSRPEASFGI